MSLVDLLSALDNYAADCPSTGRWYKEEPWKYIEKWAAEPSHTMTLCKMLDFGRSVHSDKARLLQSARFVQRELPIRLAKRLTGLNFLPYIVVTNPHIKEVYNAYHKAFHLLKDFPPVTTIAHNNAFTALLKQLSVLKAVEKAIQQCQQVCSATYGVHPPFEVVGDVDTSFVYIPAHLDYMLYEVLKMISVPGYGTDVYLRIHRLGLEAEAIEI